MQMRGGEAKNSTLSFFLFSFFSSPQHTERGQSGGGGGVGGQPDKCFFFFLVQSAGKS